MSVRPRSETCFLSIWRLRSTKCSARSSSPKISSPESPSIPNRSRWLRTKVDFWAMFIKAGSIGPALVGRKGAGAVSGTAAVDVSQPAAGWSGGQIGLSMVRSGPRPRRRAAAVRGGGAGAGGLSMAGQVEAGHLCPITMTHAAVAAFAVERALVAKFMPKIMSRRYDPRFRPWWEKGGVTLGMGMTERQGGTDVRTNTTRAEPPAQAYGITGHKWFMSAPMCDAFLVLAQAQGGLTCFLMPRFRPDGTVNGLYFQRLKDKLGNRPNASSQVEFVDAFAWRVGEEGRGVRTIINMVQLTRLDCAIPSAAPTPIALPPPT